MQLLERHHRILDYLRQKKDFVKGSELANLLGVTDRTIRGDIQFIKEALGDDAIEAVRAKGYRIAPQHKGISKVDYCDIDLSIPNNRVMYLLKQLILAEQPLDIFDLADACLVSERSIEADLQRLKKILVYRDMEGVELKRNHYEVELLGIDQAPHNLLYDVAKYLDDHFAFTDYQLLFTDIHLEYLKHSLSQILDGVCYDSKYLAFNCFLFDILVMLETDRQGLSPYGRRFTALIAAYPNPPTQPYLDIAQTMAEQIKETFGISLHLDNQAYLCYLLQTKAEMSQIERTIHENQRADDTEYLFFMTLLQQLKEERGVTLIDQEQLCQQLIVHLKIAMERIRRRMKLYNPLSEKMRKEYSYAMDLAIVIGDKIELEFGLRFDFNELSYIAIYLASVLHSEYQRLNADNQLKLLLYVPEGIGVLNLLNTQISALISTADATVDGMTSLHFDGQLLDKYNLVVTTSKRLAAQDDTVFLIQQSFNAMEKTRLQTRLQEKIKAMHSHNRQRICELYFHENLMFFNKTFQSKQAVLTFLSQQLEQAGYVESGFLSLVCQREAMLATELETGIAFPHALHPCALRNGVAMVWLKQPIVWEQMKVRCVCMLSNTPGYQEQRQTFISTFMGALADPAFTEQLKFVSTYQGFIHLFEGFFNMDHSG